MEDNDQTPHPHVLHLLLSLLTPSLRGKLPATSSKSFLFPTAQSYHSGPVSFLDCCVCPPLQTVSSLLSLILHHLILFSLSFLIQKSQSICTFPFFWQFLHYLFSTTPCDFLCSDSVLLFFSHHEDIDWKWSIHIDVATFKYIKPIISSVFYIPKL